MVRRSYRAWGRVLAVPAAIVIGFGDTAAWAAEGSAAPTTTVVARPAAPAAPLIDMSPEKVGQYRAALVLASSHPDPRRSDLAKRTLLLLDIATAKTAAERSAKIRQLPVRIVTSAPTDGRKGTVRSFIVGGKVRLQRFLPDVQVLPKPVHVSWNVALDVPAKGPAARTGIWRNEGEDGCVWDPYGEGSDECTPHAICEDDGIVGECSTQAQQEEHDIEISYAAYEADQINADIASFNADVDSYCANYPWSARDAPPDRAGAMKP